MNIKQEIERLEKIRMMVVRLYSYTEGANEEVSKKTLINMFKELSFDIEDINNRILDEVSEIKKNVN